MSTSQRRITARGGWFRPAGLMNRPFGFDYVPSGFAATTVPDVSVFDRERYDFEPRIDHLAIFGLCKRCREASSGDAAE